MDEADFWARSGRHFFGGPVIISFWIPGGEEANLRIYQESHFFLLFDSRCPDFFDLLGWFFLHRHV